MRHHVIELVHRRAEGDRRVRLGHVRSGPAPVASAAASAAVPGLDAVQFTDPGHGWVAGAGQIPATTDGGRTWTRQYSGGAVLDQVDFTDAEHGWAAGRDTLLRTTNGGQRWTPALTEPASSDGPKGGDTPDIECAGSSGPWVLFLGQGAALSHAPYLAYATKDGQQWHGLFEESYIEIADRPSLKLPDGPGSYPGPFSAIDSGAAAFVGYSPPMGYGAAPVMLASVNGGTSLTREGDVAGINEPFGAAFLSRSQGWVVGENLQTDAFEIEATVNSGRTWTTQYTTR